MPGLSLPLISYLSVVIGVLLLFADAEALGTGAIIGAAATAIGGAVVMIIKAWSQAQKDAKTVDHEIKQEERAGWQKYAERLECQLEKHQRQIDCMAADLADALVDQVAFQAQILDLYVALERARDWGCQCSEGMKRLGGDPGPIFELPPRPDIHKRRRTEFHARQVAQDSATLQATTEELKKLSPARERDDT